ncbi:SyrB-like regulator [Ensifer sp. ENS12]|uniref:SyrB-like regulator n=2 Tax=Ensifer TaxID=106591 RepID=UPI0021060B31|nr:SyrB-like regulator [Ensifer sp. ENS12]
MTSLGVIVDSARYSLEKIISSRGKTLMADESNTETTETAPPAEAAPPRKRRGPRPKNVVSDATAETPEAVAAQPMRGRRKRADRSAEAPAVAKTRGKKVGKGTGKTRGAKQTIETPAPVPVLDDIADLRQLEEENARLRKALAEKLRAENADLRKRLGLA